VSNGSFEQFYSCSIPYSLALAKSWRYVDSAQYGNCVFNSSCYPTVPFNSFSYQYPRTGQNYITCQALCEPTTCPSSNSRGYLRNRLKGNLQSGKTYCVRFFVNICENSSYGIDAIGAYFGDNSLDTITKINYPLSYLTPQVQNSSGNVITDTLNWTMISGTFVATGSEKHLLIGNFKSDAATNKTILNHYPAHYNQFTICTTCVYTNILIDDVSCIPIDLPAYAGPDMFIIPGSTVYIGRQQDVGIDEACTWYNITNTTTPIGMAAGITVSPSLSSTYIVKQDICGNIKWDTVVVYMSGVGLEELRIKNNEFKISPNPASDFLNLSYAMEGLEKEFTRAEIVNSIGELIKEGNLNFSDKRSMIDLRDLPAGVYLINLKGEQSQIISKRFIISR
jgi:hypothetical protein